MKKTSPSFVFALAAIVVLATAGAALAQSDMGNAPTTGATFTVGVVDSFGDNSVTIKKDSGDVVTILLEDATVGKAHLVNGNRVRIDYRLDEQNQPIAQEIEIGGGQVAAAPVVETETQVAVETPAPAPAETYTAPAPEPAPAVTQTTTIEEPAPEALPATASRLTAYALLGLLALASGVAIRIFR